MADNQEPTQALVEGLWSAMKDRAAGLGTAIGPGVGGKAMTQEEKLQVWNRRALAPEQVEDLWRQGRTPETLGQRILTPEEIAQQEFPDREKYIKSGGRLEPKQWFKEADAMAAYAEEQRQQGQPPPTDATTMPAEPPAMGAPSLPAPGGI